MNTLPLIIKEIRHRRLNFVLALLAVAAAVACVVGTVGLLAAYEGRTREMFADRQARAERRLAEMEDSYRRIMKRMGFNVLILPEGQQLGALYDTGYAEKLMPEEYVHRLANSNIMTVRHLLPMLERKVDWPEQQRKIILVGVRGEVPLAHKPPKKPILQRVPEGKIVLGHELWRSLDLQEDETVTLMGRRFTVHRRHRERGSKDDVTAWIPLSAAQEMLNCEGQINAIRALECRCAWADAAKVKEEIQKVLPGTRVQEEHHKALVRAQARRQAARTRTQELADARRQREASLAAMQRFAGWLVPLVIVVAAASMGLLALANVRERVGEIAILRALGVSSPRLMRLFLGKAVLLGLLGAVAGTALGAGLSLTVAVLWDGGVGAAGLQWTVAFAAIGAAPALAAVASWIPASLAARQDPAAILARE
ncbi:MAG: ABC transporter permease [Planctomycetota bacterium]